MPKPPPPSLLAPPPAGCVCGTASAAGRRPPAKALLFDLEGRLPHAAEDLAADFVPLRDPGDPGAAWGVAAPAAPLADLLGDLEDADAPIGPVVPWPLLAGPGDPASADPTVTVWASDGGLELVEHAAGAPRGWTSIAAARRRRRAARTASTGTLGRREGMDRFDPLTAARGRPPSPDQSRRWPRQSAGGRT